MVVGEGTEGNGSQNGSCGKFEVPLLSELNGTVILICLKRSLGRSHSSPRSEKKLENHILAVLRSSQKLRAWPPAP